jgi:hypothetical protein
MREDEGVDMSRSNQAFVRAVSIKETWTGLLVENFGEDNNELPENSVVMTCEWLHCSSVSDNAATVATVYGTRKSSTVL